MEFLRATFIKAMLPIIKMFGHWHFPYTHKRMTSSHLELISKYAESGDVLITKMFGEASNLMIPGKYKHGAIYIGEDEVVEAVGQGVRKISLSEFVLKKDCVGLFRAKFATKEQREKAASWAFDQIGKPYDYEFKSDNEQFYCFELTFAAYREAMGGHSPWELRKTWGVPTVVGDDFLSASKKWDKEIEL